MIQWFVFYYVVYLYHISMKYFSPWMTVDLIYVQPMLLLFLSKFVNCVHHFDKTNYCRENNFLHAISWELLKTLLSLLNLLPVGYVYKCCENVIFTCSKQTRFLQLCIVFWTKWTHTFELASNIKDAPETTRKATFELQSHCTQKSAKSFFP